jgi:hypothetical protein
VTFQYKPPHVKIGSLYWTPAFYGYGLPAMAIEAPTQTLQGSRPEAVEAPFLIVGVTVSGGQAFRPGDWAERLAGVMACYRPPGSGRGSPLQYSPYVMPRVWGAFKALRVDPAIAKLEPMALGFLLNFARDNDLQVLWECDEG